MGPDSDSLGAYEGWSDLRPGSNEHHVLGNSVEEEFVPPVGDPVRPPPKKGRHSAESFDDPIYVMEGGELVDLHSYDDLHKYLTLEMLSSKNFCAKRKFTVIQNKFWSLESETCPPILLYVSVHAANKIRIQENSH